MLEIFSLLLGLKKKVFGSSFIPPTRKAWVHHWLLAAQICLAAHRSTPGAMVLQFPEVEVVRIEHKLHPRAP